MKHPESLSARYVLYFGESLRGLSVGAPVTLLGLLGGEVTNVGLDLDPVKQTLRGRVEIVAYPERLIGLLHADQLATGQAAVRSEQRRHALFQGLVERRGLRAQLRSGSLLTGQLYVALDLFPEAPPAKMDWTQEVPVLPVVPSTIPEFEARLASILAKLDTLPYEAIGQELTRALASADQVLKRADALVKRADDTVVPALNATLEEARRVLASADGTLKNEVNPALDEVRRVIGTADGTLKNELNATLAEVRRTVTTANTLLLNTDATLLGKDAPGQQELRDALQEIARAARSLRALTDFLERHPESLIRGKIEGRP
jgi:paraquat-inducible protein B